MSTAVAWPPVRDVAAPLAAVGCVIGAAVVLGPLVVLQPRLALLGMVGGLVAVLVWRVPAAAAFLTITITPLVAGIDRGRVLPVLRPNEALVGAVSGILVLRALVEMRPGWRFSLRLTRLEATLVAMAVANSVVPLIFMLVRGRTIEADDISYALVLWKYLGVYVVVRATVRSERAVRWCLWGSMVSAAVVALIGILQALDLLGVRQLLIGYYAPFGYTGALAQPRGGSTLALPAAAADLSILNLVVAAGLWRKDHRHPLALGAMGSVFVFGVLAAAEFSSAIGLLIAVLCVAVALRKLRLLAYAPAVLAPAVVVLWPVINHRLVGFQGTSGLPISWTTRWSNLQNYFWPELFSGWNPILGVRPAARVVVSAQGTGFVWIESGYTWLLWGGGLPLFAAFCWFVPVACRSLWAHCRELRRYPDVAALAALAGVLIITALMIFDPHLTYRGSADCLFALFALAAVRTSPAPEPTTEPILARTGERP